ncbi:Phosphatidylinositolglycan class N-domain-containing protein [Protomyces lactucae-debilis]|uniref:GPI ethanolamine phosphate transferase 1 n=1 Tax=Protomyces lactucae-debilis TaxID=2754530 RepID=A0A1Y2FII8_PROLT|nr:Phosphatidylinositolglycan class N-domain-containing protein [Protomyces lactucae-debilis]ORY83743.1 Phosphatidylinositolglycan class N-domain-containing protein [Protomyces lactucae-debilis]
MLSRAQLLGVGVLFHLVYLRSIFDIYFKSPVVHLDSQFLSTPTPAADRLFLIVGDGLRADKLFEHPELAPHLHSKALHHGRWGISHTRVPTESRPGHVALIAGLYEDVSSVTTGWQLNPVHFDSVFNQSDKTHAWGSPDILPMFREGASDKGRVDCNMYDAHKEDFTEQSDALDTWVFDRVTAYFENRPPTPPKTIYFLHLLGLDTAGHAHRPYSKEYLHNIGTVDRGLAALEKTLEAVLTPDELAKSAFLFTADHGMSDWGSHGDGHPDNTRTPYIAWGAGFLRPDRPQPHASLELHHTVGESFGWDVESRARIDVAQADLAALMAFAIGVPLPKNNVGTVPVDLLELSAEEKRDALLQNARQIHAQYAAKLALKKKQLRLTQVRPFTFSQDFGAMASPNASQWIAESLNGMRYLQRYDWLFLRTTVSLGYIGWMLLALLFVVHEFISPLTSRRSNSIPLLAVGLAAYLLERSAPISYYAYAIFPLFFWHHIIRYAKPLDVRPLFGTIALGLFIVAAATQTYTDRRALSVLLAFASTTPLFYPVPARLAIRWAVLCLVMASFTLLPTVQQNNTALVVAAGIVMSLIGLAWILYDGGNAIVGGQVGLICLTVCVTASSAQSLAAKQGLSTGNQVVGWLCLVGSLGLPLLHGRQSPTDRLMVLFLTFCPTFVILSVSYEGFFYLTFWALLLTWTQLESCVPRSSPLQPSDLRIAFYFYALIQIAFFSTGNIASVSAFTLDSVYRLLPIFNPFAMGLLLIYKLLVPFIVLSANLGALNKRLDIKKSAIFSMVLIFCDAATLVFFWHVKDEASLAL